MAFILIAGASILFTSRFDADSVRLARETADRKVLLRAKQALIARAVLDANIPGSLPCPDNDNDGDADLLPCAEVGRLPWQTLDLPELRDYAGEILWYAMSGNYMDRPASIPLNSDVPGELTLDGPDTVVALVFAPGVPLGPQTQRSVNPTDVTQFLDGENADIDGAYTALTSATQNDIVVPITAAEIMSGVHKRAMSIAEDLLREHLADNGFGNYIWLAPFDNPAASNFMAGAGVREGHIPLHVTAQNYSTDYTVDWSITGPGVQLNPGPNTLTIAELQDNAQTVLGGTCANAGAPLDSFDCLPATAVQAAGLPPGVSTRTFDFDLPAFVGDSGVDINPPSALQVGSRDVSVTGAVFAASPDWVIRITDRDAGGSVVGGGTITFDNLTSGDLAVNGIHLAPEFDLALRPADVWYLQNNWHDLIYMAIAPGYAPGAPNDCAPGCLTLLNGPPAVDDKPALLMVAGAPLAGARPSALLSDYLEADNATPGDDVFVVNFTGPVFNDSVRILAGP
jgi:hypothetical protein